MRYSSLVERLDVPSSRAWDIHFEAKRRQQAGEDIIILSIGDHEFDTPSPIVSAVKQSLDSGRHHYTPAGGEVHFRTAVAKYHQQVTGQTIDENNITAMPGAQCGLFASGMALFEKGDEVLAADPMYSTYEASVNASGAELKPIPLLADQGFQLDLDALCDSISSRTKGLLLNFPHNPTGAVLSHQDWQTIAGLCEKHDLSIISDEVYASLVFEGEHISPVSVESLAPRTVVVTSLSKSHAMTGWRIGWTVASAQTARHIEHLANCILFGVAPFIQDAAVAALNEFDQQNNFVADIYRRRRDVVCEHLSAVPNLNFHKPQAGIYFMLDVRECGVPTELLANRLLDKYGLSLLPGEAFGPNAAGFLRLSLCAPEDSLIEACQRLSQFLSEC